MQAYIVHGGLPPSHGCEIAVQWTYDQWLDEGEVRSWLGVPTLIFGIVGMVAYILCIIVLLQPDLRCFTAYKLLLQICICQLYCLAVNCVLSGIFFIKGVVFCNYPHLNYISGCFAMLTWGCNCVSCLILNVSRLVDLWNPAMHDVIFGGKRVIYSFAIIYVYATILFMYSQPTVFNSKELGWLFDPLVYPKGDHFWLYASYVTVVNNEGTVTTTLILIILFFSSLTYKSIVHNFHMSSTQKQLFVQSTFSGLSTFTTASIYVSLQFVSGGRLLNFLANLAWQITTCEELILFLFINKTVQKRVLSLIKLRKLTTAMKSTFGNTTSGPSGSANVRVDTL